MMMVQLFGIQGRDKKFPRALMYCGTFFLVTFSSALLAVDSLLFNDNSVTFQRGDHYKVGDNDQQTWTFEHLSVWTWGDVFFFYDDVQERSTGHSSYYYELASRLSLSKLTGESLAIGPVKDVYLTGTIERGSDGFETWLLGGSVDLDIPGVAFFSSSVYYRDTDDVPGDTWQATFVWTIPFALESFDFQFDGYADIRGDEGSKKGDVNFNPQLKLDVGKMFGYPKLIYSGVEYSHWDNKFGIDGVDERNLSGLIQVKFAY